MTGRPCGERGTVNRPSMSKCSSWCSNDPALRIRQECPRFLVRHDLPGGPRVEELRGGLQKLRRPGVAVFLGQEATAAEVLTGEGVPRGDDVPGGTPAREVIEAGELARHFVRLVEGGVDGAGQTQMLGDRGERSQHGERVGAADDVQVVDEPVLLPQPEPFGQEQEVEFGPFRRLGQMHERAERNVAARPRVAPHGRVVDPGKMNCQVNLLHGAHRPSLVGTSTTTAALRDPVGLCICLMRIVRNRRRYDPPTRRRHAVGACRLRPLGRPGAGARATRTVAAKVSLTRTTWRPARSSRLAAMPARKPAAQWTQTVPRGISRMILRRARAAAGAGPRRDGRCPIRPGGARRGPRPPACAWLVPARQSRGPGRSWRPGQGGAARHSARPRWSIPMRVRSSWAPASDLIGSPPPTRAACPRGRSQPR